MITSDLLTMCRDFSFCPDCLDLRGQFEDGHSSPSTKVQLCGCWRGRRHHAISALPFCGEPSELATLCRGCGTELLETGGPLSVWFCDRCEDWVDRLNEFSGGYLIPVGHAPVTPTRQLQLQPALLLLTARDRRLRAWNLRDLGFEPHSDVRLPLYFDVMARQPLDRVARFADLCETFGVSRDVAYALTRSDLIDA
ncbi:MAG: hypothetical protein U0V87_10715 [Acidobacteriota bacterium]